MTFSSCYLFSSVGRPKLLELTFYHFSVLKNSRYSTVEDLCVVWRMVSRFIVREVEEVACVLLNRFIVHKCEYIFSSISGVKNHIRIIMING